MGHLDFAPTQTILYYFTGRAHAIFNRWLCRHRTFSRYLQSMALQIHNILNFSGDEIASLNGRFMCSFRVSMALQTCNILDYSRDEIAPLNGRFKCSFRVWPILACWCFKKWKQLSHNAETSPTTNRPSFLLPRCEPTRMRAAKY
jgi:hypothetical protein